MNAFCASVNFDAFIAGLPSPAGKSDPETLTQNDPVSRGHITRRNPLEVLRLVEETFDQVALAVKLGIDGSLDLTVVLGGYRTQAGVVQADSDGLGNSFWAMAKLSIVPISRW
jgi:hypothetical protein